MLFFVRKSALSEELSWDYFVRYDVYKADAAIAIRPTPHLRKGLAGSKN